MMKKILVTGDQGYIGSVLCQRLEKEGFLVIGLDTGYYEGCAFLKQQSGVSHINKDIRNVAKEDVCGIDAIIHLAALSNDPMGALDAELTQEINFKASLRLAKVAKSSSVKRFIFSSSCSMYGVSGNNVVTEESPLDPLTEYARSKVATEEKISELADTAFSPVFLRNATVYGVSPMLRLDLVVNNLCAWAHTTNTINIMSDGSPWRPLIHVNDICEAFLAALRAPQEVIHNQTFNVGREHENYQIKDIAAIIQKNMPGCKIAFTKEHGSDSRSYKVSFKKFAAHLSKYATLSWDVEKGVTQLLHAYKTEGLSKNDFMGGHYIRLNILKNLIASKKLTDKLFWRE